MSSLATALLVLAGATTFDESMASAVRLYNDAEWDAALKELSVAERWAKTDEQQQAVWLHQGIMLANVPDTARAREVWAKALALDAQAALPLAVSPRVKALFQEVQRAALARLKSTPKDAPVKAELVPAPVGSDETPRSLQQPPVPWVPVISLGAAVLAGGVALGFAISANEVLSAARASGDPQHSSALRSRASTQSLVSNLMFGVAGAAALTALLTFILLD